MPKIHQEDIKNLKVYHKKTQSFPFHFLRTPGSKNVTAQTTKRFFTIVIQEVQVNHNRKAVITRWKIDLPTFSGKVNMEAFLDWVQEVESFFSYSGTPEEKKVIWNAYKLRGGACFLWDQAQIKQQWYDKHSIRTW